MVWCFSTRASVATVLTTHPCVSRCLRVNPIAHLHANTHKRHPIACLLRQDMGCLLWVQNLLSRVLIVYISCNIIKIPMKNINEVNNDTHLSEEEVECHGAVVSDVQLIVCREEPLFEHNARGCGSTVVLNVKIVRELAGLQLAFWKNRNNGVV